MLSSAHATGGVEVHASIACILCERGAMKKIHALISYEGQHECVHNSSRKVADT